jgi:hypothetical protein
VHLDCSIKVAGESAAADVSPLNQYWQRGLGGTGHSGYQPDTQTNLRSHKYLARIGLSFATAFFGHSLLSVMMAFFNAS